MTDPIFFSLLLFLLPISGEQPDSQELCILIVSINEYDCEWTLVMWQEGQRDTMEEYRLKFSENPEKERSKMQGMSLAGFYIPDYYGYASKQVHIYLPTDNTPDIFGHTSTTSHEVYGHAFPYVNHLHDLHAGKDVGLHCPCNFHGGV